MKANDAWDEIPEAFKEREISGLLLVLCTAGEPLIYRTMSEQHYLRLLDMLKTAKEQGTCTTN